MLKFHIIIIKFNIVTNKNSQSNTFFPKLKNTIVKIDTKSFSVFENDVHEVLFGKILWLNFIICMFQMNSDITLEWFSKK